MDKYNKTLGLTGENHAAEFLESKGYHLLERNFTCKTGEVDIIAKAYDTIVFIEVKTRTGNLYGNPSEAVTKNKQQKIAKTALYYISKHKLFDYMTRFDVIEVLVVNELKMNINHIENAFFYTGKYGY